MKPIFLRKYKIFTRSKRGSQLLLRTVFYGIMEN